MGHLICKVLKKCLVNNLASISYKMCPDCLTYFIKCRLSFVFKSRIIKREVPQPHDVAYVITNVSYPINDSSKGSNFPSFQSSSPLCFNKALTFYSVRFIATSGVKESGGEKYLWSTCSVEIFNAKIKIEMVT